MKQIVLLILVALVMLGCDTTPTADQVQQKATAQSLKEADAQIGMPAIVNFQERKLAKMIFELRDKEDLITYAYVVTWQGELVFIGRCIGFGLPYSVQYTNPMKRARDASGRYTIPQADPNGLFMPDGLSATWLMMYDEATGEVRPVYVEPQIIVSPFPLH
ncbi:hypothetical protein LCGC14_0428620 [marine sediment metagenome]|uniref:Uncharacterized protein n=1 Tax=marine sediment metagenome TaxID=412755 RepID=A0A0F9T6Y5_9ZZZZ